MRILSVQASTMTKCRLIGGYLSTALPGISTVIMVGLVINMPDSWMFVVITVTCHVFVVAYTIRACYSTVLVCNRIKYTANDHQQEKRPIQAIFVPNYNETRDTLRENLSMLACHEYAAQYYEVYLAMEQTEQEAEEKGSDLVREFGSLFRYITYTIHPQNLPGEARGKSSNLRWVSRVASDRYDSLMQSNVIFTAMDADTHLLPSYFDQISSYCSTHGTDNHTMFVAPIVFDRNAAAVSPLVRCADVLWSTAGIAGLFPTSTVKTPTSVYSITMTLARYVGFWDPGSEAIGEDLHMYLKCFFATRGNLISVSVYSPASHCNVEHSDVLPHMPRRERWILSQHARFQQACRHMWGIVDAGYAVRALFALVTDYTIKGLDEKYGIENDNETVPWWRVVVLMHRLYEAHFLPVHYLIDVLACSLLPLFIAVKPNSVLDYVLVYTNHLRTAAFFGVVIQMVLYERLHSTALALRLVTIRNAPPGLIKNSLEHVGVSARRGWIYCLDYILFPVAGTVFGAVPAIKAQAMQFYTTRFAYKVSSKPSFRHAI
ncbi:hypothetical protein V1512DRAFT_116967 [Lipomyces arxii]|uniref:uncharacterized protein n=1 Tax=Lipomyces arxii TaxID=56418 RepID=UPI0034CDDCE3